MKLTQAERDAARELRALGFTNKVLRPFFDADKKTITEAIRGVTRGQFGFIACYRCKTIKTTSEFRKEASKTRGGRVCKECQAEERKDTKAEVIAHYGGICYCCGEANLAFLTLDHSDNTGHIDRREGGGVGAYSRAKRLNYPTNLRVACYNCNCGRQYANGGGGCPHMGAAAEIKS